MKKQPIRVAITGAAGQIGYALAFRVAAGELFGVDQPVRLHLIELADRVTALKGLVMELEDCAFPLLSGCVATAQLELGFEGVQWALLVGSVPRKAGMERKDLLGLNAQIFIEQGRALQAYASPEVRILVVGNPCNTNAWIAQSVAPAIPQKAWFAMTRLDENRACAQLAARAGVNVSEVTRMAVWGNHSATQYPDFHHALIAGRPAREVIQDEAWLENVFLKNVQTRGAEVIAARGASSAASAAQAIIDTVQSVTQNTPQDDWHSVAVMSSGQYGVPPGTLCSFPVRCKAGAWEIVEGLSLDPFSQKQIRRSVDELLEEQAAVRHLLSL